MALDDSLHLPYFHDGEDSVRRADMANRAFGGDIGRHLCLHDLVCRQDLPHGHPDVWQITFLQGNFQVVEIQIE